MVWKKVLKPAPYDPDARDADGDGLVQEGTIWERPGGSHFVDAAGRAIARGAMQSANPSTLRLVDSKGKPIKGHIPASGGSGDGGVITPPRDGSPLGLSLREMGLANVGSSFKETGTPTVLDITHPPAPEPPKTPASPKAVPRPDPWTELAPDGKLYRAQIPGADHSNAPDDSVIYFSGDRSYVSNFGSDVIETTDLPKSILDIRNPEDQQTIHAEASRIAAELDKAGQELEGRQRTNYLSAQRDFNKAMSGPPTDQTLGTAIANLTLMINATKGPDDPFRPGTAQRAILDSLGKDALIDREADGGFSVAMRKMPKLGVPTPPNTPPSMPRTPTEPPMSGRVSELADQAGGDWAKFAELLNNEGFVVFDYETTGFGPGDGNIPVQVGATKFKDGKEVERLNLFMNPDQPLPTDGWSAANLKDGDGNPLTNEFLQQQISRKEAHDQLAEFIGGGIVVAHNLPFDQEVMNRTRSTVGATGPEPSGTLDTLELARQVLPKGEGGPDSHALGQLSDFLGVPFGKAHTADADAAATGVLLNRVLEEAISRRVDGQILSSQHQRDLSVAKNAKYKADMDAYQAAAAAWQHRIASGEDLPPLK